MLTSGRYATDRTLASVPNAVNGLKCSTADSRATSVTGIFFAHPELYRKITQRGLSLARLPLAPAKFGVIHCRSHYVEAVVADGAAIERTGKNTTICGTEREEAIRRL
jgi:hypothetical protein